MNVDENMIKNSHVFLNVKVEGNDVILHNEICNDSW